jgi:vitamin B12 transporter
MFPVFVFAVALDPVIVSSKSGLKKSQMSISPDVITEEDIQSNISNELIDVLRSQTSLNVTQTGGPGSSYNISIRGAESRHTLVLIDGIRANDPSDIGGSFNMPALSTIDIEKIEILKGPQSLLYGSDAIGGVINIITKKGEDGGKVSYSQGATEELAASLTVFGATNVFYINTFYNESNPISSYKDGTEKDLSINRGLTLNYAKAFSLLDIEWQYKAIKSYNEFDDSNVDSSDNYAKNLNQNFYQKITIENLKHSISHQKTDRFSKFSNSSNSNYQGTRTLNEFNYNALNTLFGITHEYLTYEQTGIDELKINQYAVFINHAASIDDYFYSAGVRSDYHEEFKNYSTYGFGLGKNLGNRKQIKVNYSTGFKSPTLYQLYTHEPGTYPTFGNENLKPETSKTLELTILKSNPVSGWTLSFYDTRIDDFIIYDNNTYINESSLRSYGVDIGLNQLVDKFSFTESISLNRSIDTSKKYSLRKPQGKANLGISYKLNDKNSLNLNSTWVSAQYDFNNQLIKAYDITNIVHQLKIKDFILKNGIRNVFDREYEELKGYGTLGLNIYTKIEYNY